MLKDSKKMYKFSLVMVIVFSAICLLSPFAFSSAFFTNLLQVFGSGKTPAIYTSIKSEYLATSEELIINDQITPINTYQLVFTELNENGLKITRTTEGGVEISDAPVYVTNFIDSSSKSTINGLLRMKIGISWEDDSPSNAGIQINIPSDLWVGTAPTLGDSLLTTDYIYYKGVVSSNQMIAGDFSTYIPVINSIICVDDAYLSKRVTITVYSEIIQANDYGLNIWHSNFNLPDGWANIVATDENYIDFGNSIYAVS